MKILRVTMGALAVAATPACEKAETKLVSSRVDLPGFSIELPTARVSRSGTLPSAGLHELDLASLDADSQNVLPAMHRSLVVSWNQRTFPRSLWSDEVVPVEMRLLAAREFLDVRLLHEETIDASRWFYVLGNESRITALGVVSCDPQFAVIVRHAWYRDTQSQSDAIRDLLESVRCAVTDANRAPLRAATRLPAKFGRDDQTGMQLYRSLDHESVTITLGPGDIQASRESLIATLQPLMENLLSTRIPASSFENVPDTTPTQGRKISVNRMRVSGLAGYMQLAVTYCEDIDSSVIALWYALEQREAVARERTTQVGCPGEPTTQNEFFAELAKRACAAGDTRGCAIPASPR